MKKIVLLTCIILLPLAAMAQHHQFRSMAAPGPNGPQDPVRMVAEYLGLTPEQGDAWRALMETLKTQQQALADQVQPLEEQLREALQATTPDPAAIGALVLQIHALRDQMRVNEEAYRSGFEALLNEEQKQKLHVLRAASELAPLFPAFRDTRLL
jgi:Spy/CpxP family protein refolding chaperone